MEKESFVKIACVFLTLFFLAPSLFAEYYRYTGDNGVICFTDNFADVPVAQRIEVNRYEEIKTFRSDEDNQDRNLPLLKSEPPKEDKIEENEALSMMQKLNKEKEILDNCYEQLVAKKQAIKKEKISFANSVEANAYQEKVIKLNQEISDFENRRQVFEQKVKAFNAKIGQ